VPQLRVGECVGSEVSYSVVENGRRVTFSHFALMSAPFASNMSTTFHMAFARHHVEGSQAVYLRWTGKETAARRLGAERAGVTFQELPCTRREWASVMNVAGVGRGKSDDEGRGPPARSWVGKGDLSGQGG
jgi:hypothetical protein